MSMLDDPNVKTRTLQTDAELLNAFSDDFISLLAVHNVTPDTIWEYLPMVMATTAHNLKLMGAEPEIEVLLKAFALNAVQISRSMEMVQKELN
jgi:hypothetical protein